MNTLPYFEAARKSSWGLRKLNFLLLRVIPFNKPHNIRVTEITKEKVVVEIPFKRFNKNHLRGVHACALATGGEYTAGLSLLQHFDAKEFRLIMKNLNVDYFKQAREKVTGFAELTENIVQKEILTPLKSEDSVDYSCSVKITDSANNHICTVNTLWQIKPWSKVRSSKKPV